MIPGGGRLLDQIWPLPRRPRPRRPVVRGAKLKSFRLRRSRRPFTWKVYDLPISDGAITVEHALQHLLLERVFPYLGFNYGDAETRLRAWLYGSRIFVNLEGFMNYFLPPRD